MSTARTLSAAVEALILFYDDVWPSTFFILAKLNTVGSILIACYCGIIELTHVWWWMVMTDNNNFINVPDCIHSQKLCLLENLIIRFMLSTITM
uniref:Uncharacterized protein n=1 Tax=Onchocerca volvulus TaxID=6282 RepID=A0A8R1TVD5_ONCVO